jgi:hypothetical protein
VDRAQAQPVSHECCLPRLGGAGAAVFRRVEPHLGGAVFCRMPYRPIRRRRRMRDGLSVLIALRQGRSLRVHDTDIMNRIRWS